MRQNAFTLIELLVVIAIIAQNAVEHGFLGRQGGIRQLSRVLYKSALFMQNKPNFGRAQMNATICVTKDYTNMCSFGAQKNKAKQSQYKDRSQESEYRIQPTGCLTAMADEGRGRTDSSPWAWVGKNACEANRSFSTRLLQFCR